MIHISDISLFACRMQIANPMTSTAAVCKGSPLAQRPWETGYCYTEGPKTMLEPSDSVVKRIRSCRKMDSEIACASTGHVDIILLHAS